MKKQLLSFLSTVIMTFACLQSSGQVSISTDGSSPDLSAMVDVKSTTKGFLGPRMTFSEMQAIINPARGLMVFCTTWGLYYVNRGTPAAPIWSPSFAIPYFGIFSTSETLLDLSNTGTTGTGSVASFIIDNPLSTAWALYAETNGTTAIYANKVEGNANEALLAVNWSTGGFGIQSMIKNPDNGWPSIIGNTKGSGPAIKGYTDGTGRAGEFIIDNTSNNSDAIAAETNGIGTAGRFVVNNETNSASVLYSETNGTGDVGFFQNNSLSGSNTAVKGRSVNVGGGAGGFEISNAANPNTALYGATQGTGSAGAFTIDNPASTSAALYLATVGSGVAVHAENNGPANAIAAFLVNTNPANNFPAIQGTTAGSGPVLRAMQESGPGPGIEVYMNNASSTAPGIGITQKNLGNGAQFTIENPSNSSSALYASSNGTGATIKAYQTGTNGVAVYGYAPNSNAIKAESSSSNYPTIWAKNYASSGQTLCVISSGTNVATLYSGNTSNGRAGTFVGSVDVTGYLYKTGGGFRIDHPQDPENKLLFHSFVESPDMKNIYDGVVQLDNSGAATINLPEYFETLNTDFRYQLTCIGGYAPVFIGQEVSNNQFKIAGGTPNLKVSWQVTGIRNDAYAKANRIPQVVDKAAEDRGKYLHPKEFGKSEEFRMNLGQGKNAKN